VNIEDCEKVHRAINDPLDELNPTNDGPYILSVSSPGIDRPIKSTSDFFRNEGKEVEVTLYSKINGKKNFKGLLKSFTDKIVEIEMDGEIVGFERSSVASITPVLLF
ncbi:MAG: ribosome maturation factor RimP, partial [Clostridia bacterium]